jgi:cytochrome d ubiquinol oxidase subunit I
MDFDAPPLSQLQASALLAVNSIFPSFTIGLGSWLAVLEGLWLRVGNETFRQLYRGWVRVFAVVFGGSVVTALATPPINRQEFFLEIIAFLLEAALIVALLTGWRAGARRSHFVGTLVLALGSVIFVLTWPEATVPERLGRLLLAAYISTALLVAAVSAWRLIADSTDDAACIALRMSIGMFVICAPLQLAADIGELRVGARLGVGLAAVVLLLGLWGGLLAWRSSPERSRVYLLVCILFAPAGPLLAAAAWAGHGPPHL